MSKIMADRPTLVKMAVSDNPDLKDSMARDEYEQRPNPFNSRPNFDVIPKKKGTFKITSVKLNDTGDADSMDDLDESHTEMTEDYSSEILDTSRATDYGQETPSATEDIPLTSQTIRIVNDSKEKTGTDMHSRFRVVKIETKEPFHRGRWVCHDFLDPQPSVNTEKSETKVYDEANSGSSSAGSSIHYVHGVDDPAKNPLLAGATGTVYLPTQVPEGQVVGNQENFQPIHPAPTTVVNPMQNNTQSQISSIGYFSDSSQGQGALCQTVNQSHSHQSINSMSSVDTIQSMTPQVISGHSKQGEFHSGQVPHSQPMVNHTQTDNTKVPGMQHNAGVYLQHYSSGPQGTPGIIPGTSMSLQSGYTPTNLVSSNISEMIPHDKIASTVNNQNQATNTYQTYVHLSQQIVNPSIAQSGHSESVPGSVVKDLQARLNVPEDVSVSVTKPDASPTPPSDLKGALDKDLNEIQSPTALSPALAAAVGDLNVQTPQEEDDGGSSTVAIDNKIEQAMDLVKSHLMFAVREEVEVLKEQIKELMERTGQLEYENGILRAAASPETLAMLSQPRQQPPSSSS